ncbi:MAG: hypothetical protein D6803_06660 [Anaerolineae bacterium]|nr:MAG: hypothetical protein D6803_06660 [Anaerolineae bacterium]
MRRVDVSVGLLAAAVMVFEGALLRLLAVAQFYHFAFLVVSLALLGFGASGSSLSVSERLSRAPVEKTLSLAGVGMAAAGLAAWWGVHFVPFDAYRIAWERRQLVYFAGYCLLLVLPFLFAGLGIAAALSVGGGRSHRVYAANLVGSAVGALTAPLCLALAGVVGAVLLSVVCGLAGAALAWWRRRAFVGLGAAIVLLSAVFGWLAAMNLGNTSPPGVPLSPYKGLAYARQYPGSQWLYGRWTAGVRIDVLAGAGTRRLPGLSVQYAQLPPPQYGLSVDGEALQPITLVAPDDFDAAAWMPEALAFDLQPQAQALVVEPMGGLGVLQALAGGARRVDVVMGEQGIARAVAATAAAYDPFADARVNLLPDAPRAALRQSSGGYDVVFFPLNESFHPVTGGAYSLGETYLLTVEGMQDALRLLAPEGVLVITRWLQSPPSESLRLLNTLIEALQAGIGVSPHRSLVLYRGMQTMTFVVKPAGWGEDELQQVRRFAQQRRFDLVYLPDIREAEVNRFNRLPEALYYRYALRLLDASTRAAFVAQYEFNLRPTRDDQPFFYHFFTWRQTQAIRETLGKTWQPFGGGGYFVLFVLLGLVVVLSALLILLPLARRRLGVPRWQVSAYFALLGMAFLFVEIPLIQSAILLLGQPVYAFTTVTAALLFWSGVGSLGARARGLRMKWVGAALVAVIALLAAALPGLRLQMLVWPRGWRFLAVIGGLALPGVLMGMPFPRGLMWLERIAPQQTAWAWAINGCASVMASVLAAILALESGFRGVIALGGLAYALAFGVYALNASR